MTNRETDKKKILYVITKSNWGGAQKYVYELASGLPKEQFEAIVALGGDGILAEKLRDVGIRTISLPSLERDVNPLKDLRSFVALFRLFSSERPDIVHLNSAKVSGLGSLAARLAGVPRVIFTAHGWAFNEDRSFLSRLIIKKIYFLTILLSHKTIAVSKKVAEEAPAWGMRGKVVTIYPPVSPQNILTKELARDILIKKLPLSPAGERLWIGIVAELHKSKGIQYAIKAMLNADLQKKAILLVVGEGQERASLESLINENDLGGSVFLLGFQENAAALMSAFDIFLFPSITEAFGYVATEAGIAKLPVVASQVGGIPEIINNEETGLLIPPRNQNAIKEALLRLVETPSLRLKLGEALHKKVLSEFSPKQGVLSVVSLYEKI